MNSEVVVLGAGIIGVCCALELQEAGFEVTIIDRLPPGEATSFGNAGVISPWSCVPQCLPGTLAQIPRWLLDPESPISVRWRDLPGIAPWIMKFLANTRSQKVDQIADAMDTLVRDNVIRYRQLLKGTGHEHLLKDSWYVNVFRGRQVPNLDDYAWRLRIERGAPVKRIDGETLRQLEPALSEEYHSAVIIKAQTRAVSPGDLCKVLYEKAKNQGARCIRDDMRAVTPLTDGGYTLTLSDSTITASRMVLCGGIWSRSLLEPLGVSVPLVAERGYHLEFIDPGVTINNSILDVQGKFVVSSMQNGVRSAGTAEFSNLDAPPNYVRADMLKPLTKRLLPELNTENTHRWMGIRPSFPDNLPAIGEVPGYPALFAAFGHSHFGMGMAPATAQMVVDAVSKKKVNDDRSAYSLARFT